MSGFTPLTFAQWRTILVNQFQASLAKLGFAFEDMPDTGPDSVMGADFDSGAALALQMQLQATTYQQSSRLGTTPANPDGSVSADAASYTAPFGFVPARGSFASSSSFEISLPSVPAAPVTVNTGFSILRGDGTQYVAVADSGQANYNGNEGYTFPAGTQTISVTATCLTQGKVGNVADPTTTSWRIQAGDETGAIIGSVSNPDPITSGVDGELQADFVARFTLSRQNGNWAVRSAIAAAMLGVQAGLIVSIGDHVNADGSYHASFSTLVVNVKGSPVAAPDDLIAAVSAAVMPVRGITAEYTVIGPTLILPTFTGNVAHLAGFNQQQVGANAAAAVQNLANSIGLDQSGGTTTLSYAQVLSTMIAVPGVNPAGTTLHINGATLDITAPFASQIACPTLPAFTTS
jgi:hypothetical protein